MSLTWQLEYNFTLRAEKEERLAVFVFILVVQVHSESKKILLIVISVLAYSLGYQNTLIV